MAEVQRKRTLVNPARKRKRNPKRKLSPRQIAIFGTKRQKAALKASRKRKRSYSVRQNAGRGSIRKTKKAYRKDEKFFAGASHPIPTWETSGLKKKKRGPKKNKARRRNPGGIIEVALNPAQPKRRKSVAKRRRKNSRSHSRRRSNVRHRRNPAPVARKARRRSTGRRRNTRRRSVRRNPSMGGVSNLLVQAAYAIGGAVSSKYLTQMVLGSGNTGYVGYGANLAASFISGKLVGMFTKNKQAENAVILGGVIMTVVRFLSDQTPLGATLSQYGLGDYEASTWLSPARYIDAAKSAAVDIPTALRPQVVAAKGGMAGLRGGTYSGARGTY